MIVLDASAVLAYLQGEPGGDVVQQALPGAILSVVNFSEVLAKVVERGGSAPETVSDIKRLNLMIEPFDEEQALLAAELRRLTSKAGLSFGDRACLALATFKKAGVLTTDRAWKAVPLAVDVTLIR